MRIDGDGVAGESSGERNHLAVDPDEATATYGTQGHALGIQQLDPASDERGAGRLVDLGRRSHAEGLMWPAVVEVRSPEVTGTLLLLKRGRGDGFELERHVPVHALVPAVVGRRALARAQVLDAEA